ncbi:MAG: HAAS signaling domain-containing protein, partial [Candidatus Angelobacter sp.]
MELLDRYLQAVRFWLPRAQQDDIIAELGDDLRSQIEDRESSLGRPLSEDEFVALLKQAGHPLWVAGRYQKQQALIGPALFPLYRFVLKIAALGYLGPWLLVWIVLNVFAPTHRAGNPALSLVDGWNSFLIKAFVIFGIVTLVFAALERFQFAVTALQRWDPRKLPRWARRKERV